PPEPAAGGEEEAVGGPVPLTPIQHWFFENQLVRPQRFNQSIVMDLDGDDQRCNNQHSNVQDNNDRNDGQHDNDQHDDGQGNNGGMDLTAPLPRLDAAVHG